MAPQHAGTTLLATAAGTEEVGRPSEGARLPCRRNRWRVPFWNVRVTNVAWRYGTNEGTSGQFMSSDITLFCSFAVAIRISPRCELVLQRFWGGEGTKEY